jgi:hypothetical protein
MSRFFANIKEVMPSYKFSRQEIYSMDETGMGTVQEPGTGMGTVQELGTGMGTVQGPGSILAPKGQKRFGSVTSREWGEKRNCHMCHECFWWFYSSNIHLTSAKNKPDS